MSEVKRKLYWLKFKEDFFEEKQIKYLRTLPDGDRLTIVYLKMLLKSLKTQGILKYDNIMPSCEAELALILDEDENVIRLLLNALKQLNLVEIIDGESLYFRAVQDLTISESSSAERVRKFREKQKKALQCNTNVTTMKHLSVTSKRRYRYR